MTAALIWRRVLLSLSYIWICSYTFKNIRYAAPPVGDLRWAKPAPPAINDTMQDGSYGNACVQTAIKGVNIVGSGNTSPVGAAINQL